MRHHDRPSRSSIKAEVDGEIPDGSDLMKVRASIEVLLDRHSLKPSLRAGAEPDESAGTPLDLQAPLPEVGVSIISWVWVW